MTYETLISRTLVFKVFVDADDDEEAAERILANKERWAEDAERMNYLNDPTWDYEIADIKV